MLLTQVRQLFLAVMLILAIVNLKVCCSKSRNDLRSDHDDKERFEIDEKDVMKLIRKFQRNLRIIEHDLHDPDKQQENLERLIQFIDVVGKLDTCLTGHTKNVLRKFMKVMEDMDLKNPVKLLPFKKFPI